MFKLLCLTSAVLLAVISNHGIVVGEAAIKSGDVEEKDANSVEDIPKNETKLRLPESFYLKAYSYMKNSKAFKNFTFEVFQYRLLTLCAGLEPLPTLSQSDGNFVIYIANCRKNLHL